MNKPAILACRLPLLAITLLASGPLAAATIPDLDDPLIGFVEPMEAQQDQQVLIRGVNFGSAPLVTFNGTPATGVVYRADKAALTATVPIGASSGPLVVTNTDTAVASNAADFTVLPGILMILTIDGRGGSTTFNATSSS